MRSDYFLTYLKTALRIVTRVDACSSCTKLCQMESIPEAVLLRTHDDAALTPLLGAGRISITGDKRLLNGK